MAFSIDVTFKHVVLIGAAVLKCGIDSAGLELVDLMAHLMLDLRRPRPLIHVGDQVTCADIVKANHSTGLRQDKHVKLG